MTETVGVTFDVDALRRKVRRGAGRGGCARTGSLSTSRSPASSPDSPRTRGRMGHFAREPLHRRGRRGDRRRRLRRAADRRAAAPARRGERPVDRQGGRRRRHLVLEPLSGDRLRRRVLRLHAAAGGARLHPDREIRQGRRDLRALPPHRRALRPVPRRVPADRGARDPLGRRDFPLDHPHQPRRRDARQVRIHGQRVLKPSPSCPAFPASRRFGGHTFHTSRWDYDYTGERSWRTCPDKRVGIIGTGATAIQCVPHLAAAAQHLYVFQRTPSSVDVRANRPDRSAVGQHVTARLAATSASRTSRSSPPAVRPTRIWSPMPGRASPGSFR